MTGELSGGMSIRELYRGVNIRGNVQIPTQDYRSMCSGYDLYHPG